MIEALVATPRSLEELRPLLRNQFLERIFTAETAQLDECGEGARAAS